MATLSAAECFGLTDRGVIAPGRVADFCILADTDTFTIRQVYKNGIPAEEIPASAVQTPYQVPGFSCKFPVKADLALPTKGIARVIGIIVGEIVTQTIPAKPNTDGVQKIISVDRYHAGGFTVGLVKGFEMQTGAAATSITHDAHNIIATGKSDEEILTAVRAVADVTIRQLDNLSAHLKRTGAYKYTFGHLSFLSLTVIPHLKITPRGLFDVDAFEMVPLFH